MSNADESQDTQQSDVRIRRAPKVATFLVLGGGLGAIVTFILTAIFPVDPDVGFGALFGYFALFGVTAGVVVGALVAIVLDRRADRRASTVSAVIEKTESDDVPRFIPDPRYVEDASRFPAPAEAPVSGTPGTGDVAPPPPARPSSPVFDQDDQDGGARS